jgi:hypothetical protein
MEVMETYIEALGLYDIRKENVNKQTKSTD